MQPTSHQLNAVTAAGGAVPADGNAASGHGLRFHSRAAVRPHHLQLHHSDCPPLHRPDPRLSPDGDDDDTDTDTESTTSLIEYISEKQSLTPPVFSTRKLLLAVLLLPLGPLTILCLVPGVPVFARDGPVAVLMAGMTSLIKPILFPFLAAAILYLLISFVLVPLHRRHSARYAQYLPVALASSSSTSTRSGLQPPGYSPWETGEDPVATPRVEGSGGGNDAAFRTRATDALLGVLMPSRWAEWRYRLRQRVAHGRVVDARDEEMGDLEGDELDSESDDERENHSGELRVVEPRPVSGRRDAHERRDETSARRTGGTAAGSDRRLSRELEAGFMDSSDEED